MLRISRNFIFFSEKDIRVFTVGSLFMQHLLIISLYEKLCLIIFFTGKYVLIEFFNESLLYEVRIYYTFVRFCLS